MRQKVVPHEKAEEDEVVDRPLQVEPVAHARPVRAFELTVQVLAQHRHAHELKLWPAAGVAFALTAAFALALALALADLHLSQDGKARLVRREREHHQVRVEAMDAVVLVGVVPRREPLRAHKRHDLVLTLPRHRRVGQDDSQVGVLAPRGIELHVRVVPQPPTQVSHECRARRDHVGVHLLRLRRRRGLALAAPGLAHLVLDAALELGLLRRFEPTRALLVHLGPRRRPVHREEEQPPRLCQREQVVNVGQDTHVHLLLRGRSLAVFRVEARVDDPVHVQVKVVDRPSAAKRMRLAIVSRVTVATTSSSELLEHLGVSVDHLCGETRLWMMQCAAAWAGVAWASVPSGRTMVHPSLSLFARRRHEREIN